MGDGGSSSRIARYVATINVSDNVHIGAGWIEIKLGDAVSFSLRPCDDFLLSTAHNFDGDSIQTIASSVKHRDPE